MELQTIVFFGKSGAGKGTQSDLLIEHLKQKDKEYKTLYVETGNLLREFVKDEKLFSASLVQEVISNGGLLPEFIPVWIWSGTLMKKVENKEHLIFDGVSRREAEAPILAEAIKFFGRKNPKIILIDVSDDWAKKRLLERGRIDDREDKIDERLKWFKENVIPAINFFRNHEHFEFLDINGEQTIEKVHKDVLDSLKLN